MPTRSKSFFISWTMATRGWPDDFGGEAAFAHQQRRDARKKELCTKNGCSLSYVYQGYDPQAVLADIAQAIARPSETPRP